MGCATGCLKALLIILNIIILLLGLALTALGALALAGGDLIKKAIQVAITALPSTSSSFGLSASGTVSSEDAVNGILEFLKQAAVPILIVGIVITVISFCGMCGACCNSRCLLIIYIIALALILIAQIILMPLYATGKLDPQIKSFLNDTLKENYVEIDNYQTLNLAWTITMLQLKCCGVDNYLDFYGDTKWERIREVQNNGQTVTVTLVAPFACCKLDENEQPLDSENCATSPTDATSNWKTGCYQEMQAQLKKYDKYMIGVVAGAIGVQFLLIIFTAVIIKSITDNE